MWYAILKLWQNNGFLFLMRALIRIYIQKYHYAKIIKRLRKSQKNYPDYKIRICFLVNESAKWSVQFLYDELEKHPHFYPCILITLADILNALFLKQNKTKNCRRIMTFSIIRECIQNMLLI